jgi:hypothetical protein
MLVGLAGFSNLEAVEWQRQRQVVRVNFQSAAARHAVGALKLQIKRHSWHIKFDVIATAGLSLFYEAREYLRQYSPRL